MSFKAAVFFFFLSLLFVEVFSHTSSEFLQCGIFNKAIVRIEVYYVCTMFEVYYVCTMFEVYYVWSEF